jgi:hypothetical protein
MSPSSAFRLKALESEQRARTTSDTAIREEWIEIAIEWHALANSAGERSGEIPVIDFA